MSPLFPLFTGARALRAHSMIRKSGYRFSGQDHAQNKSVRTRNGWVRLV
jgi:hypothetical protein